MKKKNRRRRTGTSITPQRDTLDEEFWKTAETRPLVASNAIEQGLDYWISEEEMEREKLRREAKPPSPEQIPDEKLWTEVLSPYKQNWIGFISVTVIVLAFIIKNFPELTESPVIPLPDL